MPLNPSRIERLFTRLGDPRGQSEWHDYRALGIHTEDVPELITILTDIEYSDLDPENPEVWAPLHAWRALAQLGAVEAVQPYLETLDQLEDDDWIHEEASAVMRRIGPPSLPALAAFVQDRSRYLFARITVVEALETLAKTYLEARRPARQVLVRVLEAHADNSEILNGFVVEALCELRAREALPLIATAYAADTVEPVTDWEEVVEIFRLPPGTTPEAVARQL